METLVFFDLEMTLFDEWGSFVPMNEYSVSLFVSKLPKNCEFGLYSWAVYNKNDKNYFVEEEQEWIERMFGFKFDTEYLYTLEDVMKLVREASNGKKLTREEFFYFFNKKSSMLELLKHEKFKNKHLFLVDDTVQDEEHFCESNNSKLTLVNVDKLPYC